MPAGQNATSRAQRRQRLLALRKVVKSVEQRGVVPQPEFFAMAIEMAAVVAMIDEAMESQPVPGRSSRVVDLIARLHDKSNWSGPTRKALACTKGCSFCCELYVSASAPQVFAIADFLREKHANDLSAAIQRIEEADVHTRGRDAHSRAEHRAFCPFLVNSLCSIYPVRPAVCRACCSLSVAACETRADVIPTPEYTEPVRRAYDTALGAALHGRGLVNQCYELAHAVVVALKEADAEVRWYAGEDVFAGVAIDQPGNVTSSGADLQALFWDSLWKVAHGQAPPRGPFVGKFPPWCW
jgi:Fe-S-cluster containining protein